MGKIFAPQHEKRQMMMIGNLICARKRGLGRGPGRHGGLGPCLLVVLGGQGFKRRASPVAKCRHSAQPWQQMAPRSATGADRELGQSVVAF